MGRCFATLAVVIALAESLSCATRRGSVTPLANSLGESRRQPSPELFSILPGPDGKSQLIATPLDSRITFTLPVPAGTWFTAMATLETGDAARCQTDWAETFSIGVSDGHAFRQLQSALVTCTNGAPAPVLPLRVSLREYAGMTVNLVLNARVSGAPVGAARAIWRDPVLLSR